MGFIVGLIVNAALLSIPIGGTLGTLFGIRPFENERVPEVIEHNGVSAQSVCNDLHDFHLFAQNKVGLNYTVNSNEILPEKGSTLCVNMTTYENATYPTNFTAPVFSFTWEYSFEAANKSSPANETKPLIHAFPQASIGEGGVIPLTIEDLGELTVDFEWTMGTGDTIAPDTSLIRLGAREVNASVALDMYLDSNKTKAGDAGEAAFEMIIYFANFGLQDPVGFGNGTKVTTENLNGTTFTLYTGKNSNGQNVFSWVTTDPVTEFDSDILPLFNSILNLQGGKKLNVELPIVTDFLGYVGFGTQAYNSIGPVTFSVPRLLVELKKFGS